MSDLAQQVKNANKLVFNRGAGHYDAENPAHYSEVTQARITEILKVIRSNTSGERLLDAGCGTGNIFRAARELFSKVVQFDISIEMCRRAAGKGAEVICADFDHIPFPAGVFDAVTAFSVIHHLADQEILLRESWRVLKPGGYFYADYDPNRGHNATWRGAVYDWAKSILVWMRGGHIRKHEHPKEGFGQAELAEYGHHVVKGLSSAELAAKLRRAGFSEVSSHFHDEYSSLNPVFERRRSFRKFGRLIGYILLTRETNFLPFMITLARK